MYELGSMAKALDMQKSLAEDAHFIHAEVTRRKEHDPEVRIIFSLYFFHHIGFDCLFSFLFIFIIKLF